MLIGNDIVDLGQSLPSNKANDLRFLQRVFTKSEQEMIQSAHNPEIMLWIFWAAKETAYKVVSKILTPPVFSHKLFVCSLPEALEQSGLQTLSVTYDTIQIDCVATMTDQYCHVVGSSELSSSNNELGIQSQAQNQIYQLSEQDIVYWSDPKNMQTHFTEQELNAIHHSASAVVRQKVKQAISQINNWVVEDLQILRPISQNNKMQPPYLLYQNKQTTIDISLSHHGEWLGWAICEK